MQLRLDRVNVASNLDTYINYQTQAQTLTFSGTVANGASQGYVLYFPYVIDKTRADIYVKNQNTNIKRPINGGIRQGPYQAVSSEIYTQVASYGGRIISVQIIVQNLTGGPINLIPQTLEVTVVLYEVPLSG